MIEVYEITSPKNLRSSPNDDSNVNLVGVIGAGSVASGNQTSQDSKGRGLWIKLETINGSPVTKETWLAAWIIKYRIVADPVPQEPLGVPVRLKLIEIFENGLTRESTWENPVVVE